MHLIKSAVIVFSCGVCQKENSRDIPDGEFQGRRDTLTTVPEGWRIVTAEPMGHWSKQNLHLCRECFERIWQISK